MPWEQVKLKIGEVEFKTALINMAGLSPSKATSRIKCTDQFTIDVIDPKRKTISERASLSNKPLSNCILLQAQLERSWMLVSARGEFMKDLLVAVTFKFKKDHFDLMQTEIEKRFGPGEFRKLQVQSILGQELREAVLWNINGETWALWKTTKDANLVRQAPKLLEDLPPLPEAAKKGVPVNLDDIGLGGGLDLDEPLPEIPTLNLDAGNK